MMSRRLLLFFSFAAICLAVGVMTTLPINLATVDLGRHIKNGELFFSLGAPIGTNFYSFTEPDFPAVNHHWAAGVAFYLLWKAFGFEGLHLAYIALHVATVALFMAAALKRADARWVASITLLLMPLLAHRYEVRPEGVSYFALALLTFWLTRLPAASPSLPRVLVPVAVLSVVWVNSHIFFFLGWGVTLAFMLEAFMTNGQVSRAFLDLKRREGVLSAVLLTQLLASLANPWHIHGFIEPFTILREYGYMVVENQPIPFALSRLGGGVYWHYVVAGVVCLLMAIASLIKDARAALAPVMLLAFFYTLGFYAVRGMTMFALLAIPFASALLGRLFQGPRPAWAACALAAGFAGAMLFLREPYFSFHQRPHQLGLAPGVNGAAAFIKDTALAGPIFNNYDIGGYFIFHLYPTHRPFVDNRPEAYSVAFLRETYQAMLADEATWRRVDARENFNAIFFYRYDATQHAQPFLIRRIADPAWEAVYVDAYNIVLVKQNPKNARIIRDYALPKSMFSAGPTR